MSLENIMQSVSESFDVPEAIIKSHRRDAKSAAAKIAFYIQADQAGYGPMEIGRFVGKDHSTIVKVLAKHKIEGNKK